MSTSEDNSTDRDFNLVIDGGHPAAEVILVDSRMQLVDRAIGRLETRQPGGVYQLKSQIGRSVEERTILLDHDVEESMPVPSIASPIPLPGTYQTREAHTRAARRESRIVHFRHGEGATLFLFVARRSTGPERSMKAQHFVHPAHGLSIRNSEGRIVADLQRHSALGPGWDGWAAVNVAVDPGVYFLRHKTAKGVIVEQPLIATGGWQTQAFILRETSGEPGEDLARESELLANVAILLSRSSFDPGREDFLLTEAARLALGDDRPFLSQDLHHRLPAKMDNPMLGLYWAHLMLRAVTRPDDRKAQRKRASPSLREASFDAGSYARLVDGLRDVLGPDHPDVVALSLKEGSNVQAGATVRVPPMLRQSWALLVEESNHNPGIVDLKMWKRIAKLTDSRPFLSWNVPATRKMGGVDEDPLTKAIKTHVEPVGEAPAAMPSFGLRVAGFPGSTDAGSPVLPPEEVRRQISVQMGVPRFVVDEALGERIRTLGGSAGVFER